MATASYSSTLRKLSVLGTSAADNLIIDRDAAGALRVNGGAVPITGGPATTANTDLIEAQGADQDDIITLDETNGVLPAANLFGGNGNDTLTGGSNADQLFGNANDDILLGKGGNDQMSGGTGNDTMTGGTGADSMLGEDGDDRMIWNPGDGSDVMEGGNNLDTAEVNGGNGAEVFTITANGARVRFDRVDPAPFLLDIGTTERLELNAGGGDDSISTSGNLAALIALTIDGGAGNDTILGGNGADIILGGDGNDFVDGNQGADVSFLGIGADSFQWDPGDGSDVIDGGSDADLIIFNGNGANETFDLSANGSRLRSFRDVGVVVLDSDNVESVTVNSGAGTDTVTVNDLSGTDTNNVTVNLSGTIGGSTGDAQVDTVSVVGKVGADVIDVVGAGTALAVTGGAAFVGVNQVEFTDKLSVLGGAGNDIINASTLASGIVVLTLDGGINDDDIRGSAGADTLFGGDGNDLVDGNQGLDTAFLGNGNDIFNWDPGDASDVVEGQADSDELRFNGSNANENIAISPNGGRSLFTRDVAAINMDMDDVETIRFRALGGADNINIADMTGTDVTQIIVDLAASGGGGDGLVDRVTVQATAAADIVTVTNGSINIGGLFAATRIENSEVTDHLIISVNAGDDVIDASSLLAGQITLEFLGGLGADVMFGSAGADIVTGGDGNDTALLGGGDDVFIWNPGDDNDTIEGQGGIDRMDFNGNGAAEGITISANGGRALFFRDVAAVAMDLNDVEQITFNAGAGTDAVVINDLSGTDVDTIILNMAGTIGGSTGDAVVDSITVFGDGGNDNIDLLGITGTVSVLGAPAFVSLNQLDATDLVTINSGAGNDTINASQLAAGIIALTIDGGIGNDTINGTAGADTLIGGDNDDIIDGNQGLDTAFLGLGDDRFNWNPGDGSDIVEGQGGTADLLFFNGSNANENIAISANGARVSFTRDVAAINMDIDGIETIQFNAIGGTDNITINSLTGTSVTRVILNLAGNSGVADGLADTITVNATALGDNIQIAVTAPGVVTLTGLTAAIEIRNFDAKDKLIINAGDGNDTIDATGIGLALTVFGGIGDDTVTGGSAFDTFILGAGNNSVFRSLGGDFVDSAGGTTTLFI
jgi:Ca2+-binding RTX toxin-like protein